MEVSGEEKLFQLCVYKLIIRPNENNNMNRLESLYFRGKTIKLSEDELTIFERSLQYEAFVELREHLNQSITITFPLT